MHVMDHAQKAKATALTHSGMTSAEVRAWLARVGLSQSAAAREIGVGIRTFQRWCADPQQGAVPGPAVRLMVMMERHPEDWRDAA